MLVVGLTGGIGSGKSTVGKLFADLGVPVIDADEVSRIVMQPHGKAYPALRFWLGSGYFDKAGQLDRKRLRQLVFNNDTKRLRLESIVHPKIGLEFSSQLKEISKDHPYCIIEIPLLNQSHKKNLVQRVLVVDCSPELQIQRSVERDSTTKKEIQAIMNAQMSREDRLQLADDVINNDLEKIHLEQEVLNLHQQYLAIASDD